MKERARKKAEERLPVSEQAMEAKNKVFFIRSYAASFNAGSEIIHPPETATLAAAEQTGTLWERAPSAFTFSLDIIG